MGESRRRNGDLGHENEMRMKEKLYLMTLGCEIEDGS